MTRMYSTRYFRRGRPSAVRRGFSLVELLIVMAVVIILLAILLVAMSKAVGGAQAANTEALMTSMKAAMIRFKEDIGYYPPVLDQNGALYPPYDVSNPVSGQFNVNTWYSMVSPAEYLLGPGSHWRDGWGKVPGQSPPLNWANELPPLGIRHPQEDGVWGATKHGAGTVAHRMLGGPINAPTRGSMTAPYPIDQGKVYGPYLELTDEKLLGWMPEDPPLGGGDVLYPGEEGYGENAGSHVIVDYWGSPIRYYRLPYVSGSLRQAFRQGMTNNGAIVHHTPSLAHVIVLRPQTLPRGGGVDVHELFKDANNDRTASLTLRSAEFAFLSAGADLKTTDNQRVDKQQGLNEDNIVITGP